MNQKIISTEDEVKAFLKELKELLTDVHFARYPFPKICLMGESSSRKE